MNICICEHTCLLLTPVSCSDSHGIPFSSDCCETSVLTVEVFKHRKLHKDTKVGSYEERLEALLAESLVGSGYLIFYS